MARHRVGDIGDNALIVVADSVAVGVGHGDALEPGIHDRIVGHRSLDRLSVAGVTACAAFRALEGRINPLVVVRVEGRKRRILHLLHLHLVVNGGDHIALLSEVRPMCLVGIVIGVAVVNVRAENRVEAVEHFIEVVHSVAVGIGHSRIGRDVSRNGRSVGHLLRYGEHVDRSRNDSTYRRAIPGAHGRSEVTEVSPAVNRPRLADKRRILFLLVVDALVDHILVESGVDRGRREQ